MVDVLNHLKDVFKPVQHHQEQSSDCERTIDTVTTTKKSDKQVLEAVLHHLGPDCNLPSGVGVGCVTLSASGLYAVRLTLLTCQGSW